MTSPKLLAILLFLGLSSLLVACPNKKEGGTASAEKPVPSSSAQPEGEDDDEEPKEGSGKRDEGGW